MRRWTSSQVIIERIEKRWKSGELLAAQVSGQSLFPMELRLTRPTPREIADRFGEVLDWARELRNASSESRGHGFELKHEILNNRVQGANALPVSAIIPSERDALELIRKRKAAERFRLVANETLTRHPVLRDWIAKRPHRVLDYAADWQQVLTVLDWFMAHPRPGLYLRQLDIPGVDTKFVESHRKLLGDLLDVLLPEHAIDQSATGAREFNRRYGLRTEPPLVRFRLLDRALYIKGLSDLSLLPEEFAALPRPASRVFITENRTNGLAFPDCRASMVVFGLGYGLDRLSLIPWLRNVDVWYWGDIDTHGFGILNRLRAVLPTARSFLMDRMTLDAHRRLCGREPANTRYTGDTSRLTDTEKSLFEDLLFDRVGERVRLEQERIRYGWLKQALDVISAGS